MYSIEKTPGLLKMHMEFTITFSCLIYSDEMDLINIEVT